MSGRVAVIGAGMTRFVRRAEESSGELTALAVEMALRDAGLTIDDIDAVCLGTAPDAFDGIHMNGEHLIAGAGGSHKPYMRHYVGGGTGVMSPIHGWMHVASGKFRTCLVVTEEKMSPCSPHPAGAFLTIFDRLTEQPLDLTLIHIFALEMARFMHEYGYTEEEIAQVSVLCKKNAMDHPSAQLGKLLSVADVMASKMLSWPVKRFDISPTSDGAVAIVMANENVARTHCKAPVFIEGVGFRLDTAYWCTRDLAYPAYVAMAAKDAYDMAGISRPEDQIDLWEPYDPFAYKALHHMNGLLMDRTGRKVKELLASGAFERDGSHPLCPSGGALGVGNPIAATGLMKIAELYLQLSGQAGARQVARPAHRGIAQAWGDLMQVGTVVIMGSEGAAPGRKTLWKGITSAEQLPGTRLDTIESVPHLKDSPDLRYAWDNGLALTTYLDGLKKDNLRTAAHYFDLPDTGTIRTYTISNVDWDSSELPDGEVKLFGVVAIDGTSEDMGLVHLLGEVAPEDLHIGMRVRAVWKPEAEREGAITDIRYFRPLKPEEGDGFDPPVPIKPPELTAATAGVCTGKIPLSYVYSAGLAGKRFYEDLAKGKLSGTYSPASDAVLLPPTTFDEEHMTLLDPEAGARSVDPSGGFVVAFTEVYEDRTGEEYDRPVVIAQVAFPGAVGSLFGTLLLEEGQEPELGLSVDLVATDQVGPQHITFRLLAE